MLESRTDLASLSQLALAAAARDPAAVIGWRAGRAVDNAAFVARIRAWAALLRRQSGSQFALYLEDSLEFGAALLGAWQAGKTVWLTADTLAASCAALAASVDGFLGEFPSARAPLTPGLDDGDDAWPLRAIDPRCAALVVHTSGSTGAAQAIPKRLDQMASEVAALETLFGARLGQAAIVATVSHQHIYGLLFKVLWPLCAGRPIVALSVNYPEQLAALLAERPSVLVASPAHLKRLPEHLDWQAGAARLRAVFSSGGPLAPDVALASGKLLGQLALEIYGSSETGGIAWRARVAGADDSWLAFPDVEWRLAGVEHLLEVRSPHLPDAHWLQLADRARAVGTARFQLLGRSDRIVKIEEKRISLDAIEAALAASKLVLQARVLLCEPEAEAGAAAPSQRQSLAAFVLLSDAGRAALARDGKLALNRLLRAGLAGAVEALALPRRWRYPEQMPQDAQGKTTRAGLLALLDEEGTPAPRQPHRRLLEQDAARVLLEMTAPANLLYFDGHFTDAPILPGVVQLDWAIACGREYFALPARFRAVHALKFQQVIQPGQAFRLELLHDAGKGSLQFRYLSDSGQHASGRILFHHEPNNETSIAPC